MLFVDAVELVMMRKCLLGIRDRAEHQSSEPPTPHGRLRPGYRVDDTAAEVEVRPNEVFLY
jgi:hypothetical protein